jgi:hypothetical protein
VLAAALLAASASRAVASGERRRECLNRDWRFVLGDAPGAQAESFDDSTWNRTGLPHSFSEPYFLSPQFYVGYGWYRKRFWAPADWRERRVYVEFDGVFQDAEVFVNGKRVGEHRGGYTGFSFDISDAMHDGENLLAVRVNNIWNPRLAPRGGDHCFSGGIYRDVWLTSVSPLHVAWYGTFVTTPHLSSAGGAVALQIEIENQNSDARHCDVRTEILAPSGKVVGTALSSVDVAAGASAITNQTTSIVDHPSLWTPDNPVMYTAITTLSIDGKPADEFRTPFGFRWFEWTAEQGFFLNGKHWYFHGANVHQDHAGWGDAASDGGAWRDVWLMKQAGFDFIRGSHYPHSPAFADACDQLGMMFWSEVNNWNGFQSRSGWFDGGPIDPQNFDGYAASVKQTLREMIRVHRNHPSIVAWSMCNEPFFTGSKMTPSIKQLLRDCVALSHELDPTRPAAIGGCQRNQFDKLGDIAGYNGDGARLFIDPGVPNLVSEYGSTITDRPGKYDPGFGDLRNQPQFPWRSGQVIWCGFDHGTTLGRFGEMGIVDYFRLPKRAWYWYRNEYRHVPPPDWPEPGTATAIKLSSDKQTIIGTAATDDVQIVATIVDANGKWLTNSPPLTLTIESGPGEFPTGRSIDFAPDSDIAIRDGQAAIEMRSYEAGVTTVRATSPGLAPATLEIKTTGEPAFVHGVTRLATSRPYVRFTQPLATTLPADDRSLSLDRPTLASSEAAGHAASLADDGSRETFWSSNDGDADPWWQLDMEHLSSVNEVKLLLPKATSAGCEVLISEDGSSWTTAATQAPLNVPARTIALNCPPGTFGRFIRLHFVGLAAREHAMLADIAVRPPPPMVPKVVHPLTSDTAHAVSTDRASAISQ